MTTRFVAATRSRRLLLVGMSLLLVTAVACAAPGPGVTPQARRRTGSTTPAPTVFAVIGDYGSGDRHESDVASLVASWDPGFIVTTGDDYYADAGGSGTGRYDASTGRFYCRWLEGVSAEGSACPSGEASRNAFFPCLGNHDLRDARPSPRTYLRYFQLPGRGFTNTSGNERYYDFVEGDVHFFMLDSNPEEPDGTDAMSKQAVWLRTQLARSTSRYDVVCDHHPPYSSDAVHGSIAYMRWPFRQWGAEMVVSGHAHVYERVMRDGIPYVVDGLGGQTRYAFGRTVEGSAVRYVADWGAMKVKVQRDAMTCEFFDVRGRRIDRFEVAPSEGMAQ